MSSNHLSPSHVEAEAARMAAVRRYDILDTPPDGSFDRITALAASLFEVPISIISLVDTDRVWFKGSHAAEQLHVAALQVTSVARVHQHIFRNQSAGSVNAKGYIENLVAELQGTLSANLPIVVNVQPAFLAPDLLVPLGLVLNELVVNATKHSGGQIVVRFEEPSAGNLRLTVENSGGRLPPDFDPTRTTGLGMKVVVALARQLGGTLAFGTREDGAGARFWMDFPAGDIVH